MIPKSGPSPVVATRLGFSLSIGAMIPARLHPGGIALLSRKADCPSQSQPSLSILVVLEPFCTEHAYRAKPTTSASMGLMRIIAVPLTVFGVPSINLDEIVTHVDAAHSSTAHQHVRARRMRKRCTARPFRATIP